MTRSLRVMRRIFEEACELGAEERSLYLDEACSGDEGLRRRVEELLDADALNDQRFEAGVPELLDDAGRIRPEDLVGHQIGGFAVEKLIDTGGSGSIFVATQEWPRRKVALKVARTDVLTRDDRARFLREAEILGLLTHPNVARIYAGGIEEIDDKPLAYLAVEFVEDARDIVAFARERGLSRVQRLELFRALCEAVQHGHQKGVVHRDLKPGNVLVDPAGHLKVIDFGIARLLTPDAETRSTGSGLVAGTPAYMSPEQRQPGGKADTRTDVFALGVILGELLGPRPPGDLQLIHARATAEEREERYPTAAGLGNDITAFLQGAPVEAHPPSALYTLRRFVGRHRLATGLGASLLVLVVAFAAYAWREAGHLRTSRDRLAREAHKFERSTEFFASLLDAADPKLGAKDATVVAALEEIIPRLPELVGDEPEVEAHVRNLVADKLLQLGRYEEYERERKLVIGLVDEIDAPDVTDRVQARLTYASMLSEWARGEDLLVLSDEIFAILESSPDPQPLLRGSALRMGAAARILTGAPDRGRELLEEALETYRACGYRDGEIQCLEDLAYLAGQQGDPDEAVEFARACYELALEHYPPGDERRVFRGMLLPVRLRARNEPGDLAEAERMQRAMLTELTTIVGPGSFYEAVWRRNLGRILLDRGNEAGALDEAQHALDIVLELYPDTHSEVGRTRSAYAEVLVGAGRHDEARVQLTEALRAFREAYEYQEAHYEIRGIQERLAALDAVE